MQTTGAVDVGQQFIEELDVAFSIQNNHGQVVAVFWWTHLPVNVLRDDAAQGGRLAAASHAKQDRLHDPDTVRPEPGVAMDVIAKNDRVLVPGDTHLSIEPGGRYHHRWMRPLLLPPLFARN